MVEIKFKILVIIGNVKCIRCYNYVNIHKNELKIIKWNPNIGYLWKLHLKHRVTECLKVKNW